MRNLIGFIILVSAVVGLYALNGMVERDAHGGLLEVAQTPPIEVQAVSPTRRTLVRTVHAPGEVEPFVEVDIRAEVVAKIVEMNVEEGDAVQADEVLCRLDDADFLARLKSAEANAARLQAAIGQAEAELEKADRDLKRQVELSEADATSALELADYRTTASRMKAALEMRRQELIEAQFRRDSAQEDLERTVIRSPIAGVVAQRFAKAGEVVITGTMNNPGTRIMVISDLSRMQLRCRVDESDVAMVKEGQPAKIFLQSDMDRSLPAHVLRVATKGTRPTGRDVVTFETLVLVDHPDETIKPAMNANVEIEVERREEALAIPLQAVVYRRGKDLPPEVLKAVRKEAEEKGATRREMDYVKVVYVREGDEAKVRPVETGINDEEAVEILRGLLEKDAVIEGPFRSLDTLKHGDKVKDMEEKP